MIKKLMALLLSLIIVVSLSACNSDFVDGFKNAIKDVIEQNENENVGNQDSTINDDNDGDDYDKLKEDIDNDEQDNGEQNDNGDNDNSQTEPLNKSIFHNYEPFSVTVNGEYLATPMSFYVFDEKEYVEIKTQLPDTLKPLQVFDVDVKFFGQDVMFKVCNFYHDDTIEGKDATLAYYEYTFNEDDEVIFHMDLTNKSTKEDFLRVYGPYEYGNASIDKEFICYRVKDGDLADKNAYLELAFSCETGRVCGLRYGLFIPEYADINTEE